MYKEPNYKSTAWLAKYGWQKGQGLGKNRDGATDFLRVSVKTDNAGLGTEIPSPDEQFRGGFGWWDQVYNRAASAIKVNISEEEKVEVKMNKKTTTSKSNLEKFYGGAFVKASEETKEESEDKSDTATSLDEKTIFETCGGRTLSKYRFRIGKTTRAAEQEKQWESKGDNDTNEEDTRETKEERCPKKRKRLDGDRTNKEEANEEKEGKKKKKKKDKPKKKGAPEDDAPEQDQAETEPIQKTAKQRKTEKKTKQKRKSKSGPKRDSHGT